MEVKFVVSDPRSLMLDTGCRKREEVGGWKLDDGWLSGPRKLSGSLNHRK